MKYILLGVLSFISLFFFDVYTLKNSGVKKKLFGIIGLGLLIYSSIMLVIVSEQFKFSIVIKVLAGISFLFFGFLLIYSLFLELPFVNTYGKVNHSKKLIDTGTYALCRHPGVLWFGFMFFSLFLLTGARLVLYGGIIWTIFDVFHVYLQEKLFFPHMFAEYNAYINTTPMLIPNKQSIKKCLNSLNLRRLKDEGIRKYVD